MIKARGKKKPRPVPENEIAELRRLVKEQTLKVETLTNQIARISSNENAHKLASKRDDEVQSALYELETKHRLLQLDSNTDQPQIAHVHLIQRIRETVRTVLPAEATVAVISNGDHELMKLYGRKGLHFPQDRSGNYVSSDPTSDLSAIVQLEALRSRGADFLLIPSQKLSWLERQEGFRSHLERRYRLLHRDEETCAIYSLGERGRWYDFEEMFAACGAQLGREPAILNWDTGLDLAKSFPELNIYPPIENSIPLPYLEKSIDIVAISSLDTAVTAEANRLASVAVLNFARPEGETGAVFSVERKTSLSDTPIPSVSIILSIQTLDAGRVTLLALKETLHSGLHCEILLVSSLSAREIAPLLELCKPSNIPTRFVHTTSKAIGVNGCNRAAKLAKSEILVFLASGIVPQPGWLRNILVIFRNYEDAGAVGGKIVSSDGRMHEAGGVVFSDASSIAFGRGDLDIDTPRYNYVREVDFCSRAMLATPRSLFASLGGFDENCGDPDYGLKLRNKGCSIYYQPQCVGIYLGTPEEISATDVEPKSSLMNIAAKWRDMLKTQPLPVCAVVTGQAPLVC